MFLLGILWKWDSESESKLTCGHVWWHILGICALHLTHPSAHTHHCGARGAVGGSVPCSMVSPQSWYWGWRERCTFTPPTYNPCQYWDSNPWPSGHKSDSLSIRPQLPNWLGSFGEYQPWNKIKLYVTYTNRFRSHQSHANTCVRAILSKHAMFSL